MNWLFFALLSAITLSIANLLQRVMMKQESSNVLAYSIVFQFLCAIIVGIFSFFKGFVMPPVTHMPINFLLMAIFYGLGTFLLFKALQFAEASEVTIITASRSLITIISAVIFLKESFGFANLIGTFCILGAVFLIAKKPKDISLRKGALYAVGMALCYGLAVTNDVYILRSAEAISYTAIGFLFPGIFLFFLKPTVIKQLHIFLQPKIFKNMLVLCLLYSIAAVSFFTAVTSGAHASQIGPVNQSSVIITVILAAIFLKERDHLDKKFISAILVTLGVVLLR